MPTSSGDDRHNGHWSHTLRLIGTDGFTVGLKNDSNLLFSEREKRGVR